MWRYPEDPQCKAAKNGKRCERMLGHKGWHSNDNYSWAVTVEEIAANEKEKAK